MGGSEVQHNINMTPAATQGMLGLELHQRRHRQPQFLQHPPPTMKLLSVQSPEDSTPATTTSSSSSWQRMKWTDEMVRLLIVVVYYVGDDSTVDYPSSSGEATTNTTMTRKGSSGNLQQQQQRKGKWKSVSSAMTERGYNVSPQQCEDKFNDLNKRYKRVNDILGKGTACKVVENQSVLDGMDHLSSKAKEEVRKLLNSKHLFFREMCAYHSTCAAVAAAGGGGAIVGGSRQGNDPVIPPASHVPHQCGHPPATRGAPMKGHGDDDHHHTNPSVIMEDEEDDEEDNSDDEDYGSDDEEDEYNTQCRLPRREAEGDNEDDNKAEITATKRRRSSSSSLPALCQLRDEMMGLTGTVENQKTWVRRRVAELEQKKVGYQRRALELERKRFKWQKFSWKKEREMETTKLDNERLKLENERMLLLLRQKELDLFLGRNIANGDLSASFPVAEQERTSQMFHV